MTRQPVPNLTPAPTPAPTPALHAARHAEVHTALRPRGSLALLTVTAAVLAGCAGNAPRPDAEQVRARVNPQDRGAVSATHFTPALRCMDALMFSAGTRDITLMMEELRDATQRVPVSARDMMTSALSDMTRRSRAVRLSAFGNDQAHLLQLLQQVQQVQQVQGASGGGGGAGGSEGVAPNPFALLPQYSLRGSISQIDEDVQRRSNSIGAVAERFGLRLGGETRLSVLGFDAALVDTATFQVLPGVSSRNTTVISRRDQSAGDGRAQLRGAGVEFAFSTARSEGTAQAARSMVELAAVELVGKLTRLPYWQCLGLPDDHAEVLRETEDWFLSLGATERRALLQQRLRQQRWYDGPADGTDSAAWRRAQALAVSALRTHDAALPGLATSGAAAELAWFRQVLARPLPPAPPAAQPGVRATAPARLQVLLHTTAEGTPRLEVSADLPGYVYCYALDAASGSIRRIFPNRFAADPALQPGQTLQLPGSSGTRLPRQHEFACVHAPTEVYADLPPPLRWSDFEVIRLSDLQAVREAFATAAGQPVVLAMAAPPAAPVRARPAAALRATASPAASTRAAAARR